MIKSLSILERNPLPQCETSIAYRASASPRRGVAAGTMSTPTDGIAPSNAAAGAGCASN